MGNLWLLHKQNTLWRKPERLLDNKASLVWRSLQWVRAWCSPGTPESPESRGISAQNSMQNSMQNRTQCHSPSIKRRKLITPGRPPGYIRREKEALEMKASTLHTVTASPNAKKFGLTARQPPLLTVFESCLPNRPKACSTSTTRWPCP